MDVKQIAGYATKGLGFACIAFAAVALPIGLIATIGNVTTGVEQLANGVLESDLVKYQANSYIALSVGVLSAGLGGSLMMFKP